MKSCYIVLIATICIAILAFISNDLYDHKDEEQQQYCQMVSAWLDSDAENGWPDYNRNFDEVCK